MDVHLLMIEKPGNFSEEQKKEIAGLIADGGQVSYANAVIGLSRSKLIAVLQLENMVVATACVKNPRRSYCESVFRSAQVTELQENCLFELGYIVTRPGFEGRGYCQEILSNLIPLIDDLPTFATTRKVAMTHILTKAGFRICGEVYKNDLQLLIRKAE